MDYVNKKDDPPKSVVDMVEIMMQVKSSQIKNSPGKGKSERYKRKNPDCEIQNKFCSAKGRRDHMQCLWKAKIVVK